MYSAFCHIAYVGYHKSSPCCMIIDIEEVQLQIISDPLPSPFRHKTTYMSIIYTTAVVAQSWDQSKYNCNLQILYFFILSDITLTPLNSRGH